jgi:SAM-dependent methyltransferase
VEIDTVQRLLELNFQFYQTFAVPFSSTRQRLQPGVRRLMPGLLKAGAILDLGCGNGELARQLDRQGFRGRYVGVDFSPGLLAEAARGLPTESYAFQPLDLATPDWELQSPLPYDRVLAFATLHHIPSQALRLQILENVRRLLTPVGQFLSSYWQFQNSPRLAARVQPWSRVGLDESQLEAGDYLLDWRSNGEGLRYVHLFSEAELSALAAASGFRILESFSSDGEGGRLGLYQVWEMA